MRTKLIEDGPLALVRAETIEAGRQAPAAMSPDAPAPTIIPSEEGFGSNGIGSPSLRAAGRGR